MQPAAPQAQGGALAQPCKLSYVVLGAWCEPPPAVAMQNPLLGNFTVVDRTNAASTTGLEQPVKVRATLFWTHSLSAWPRLILTQTFCVTAREGPVKVYAIAETKPYIILS